MMGMVLEDRIRFWKYVEDTPIGRCWLWNGYKNLNGYGMFSIHLSMYLSHRLSWEMYNDPILYDKIHVLHRCDVPACVNPGHLFLGTHRQNVQDMHKKKRNNFTASLNPILDMERAEEIRVRFHNGMGSIEELAVEYGVTKQSIKRVVTGRTWNPAKHTTVKWVL